MPEVQEKQERPRYKIEISGSNWSVTMYGAVEFLRTHPYLRPVVVILGVFVALALFGVFGFIKIGEFSSTVLLVAVVPAIFWVAVVSGPHFELVFRESKAFDERQSAEKKFEASRTPEDALYLDFARLNEYYVINQSQARSSFRWAIFFMFLGSGTIIAGIWLFYFKTNQPDKFMASLSTAAGLVVSLCSGLFLSLYSKTQGRSLHTCSCAHSMFKSKTQWHCGSCSQCIDRRFAITAAGLISHDSDADYVSDVFLGARKEGYEKSMAVDYVSHGMKLHRLSETELATVFNAEITRAVRYETKRSEAAEKIISMHKRHGEVVTRVLQEKIVEQAGRVVEGTIDDSSLLALVIGRKHLEPIWKRYCERVVGILQKGLPVACSTHKPENEPHLQELCDGILKSNGHDLVREFPFMLWSSSLTKPDWYVESLNVVIEAKYVRKKGDLRQISEAIASDITKYGDNQYRVLFFAYDPSHIITNEAAFAEPILARRNMVVGFIR